MATPTFITAPPLTTKLLPKVDRQARVAVRRGGPLFAQKRLAAPRAPREFESDGTVSSRSRTVSQSVSFTVPPRAHPSTGSQSGSASPGLTQVPSTRSRGLLNCRKSEVNLSQRTGCSLPLFALYC